ncbi:MAG: hypothetical protein WCL39_03640 [Armatimonadota bacterium]
MSAKMVMVLLALAAVVIALLTGLIIWAGIYACREIDKFHRTTQDAMEQIQDLTERLDDLNNRPN